MKKILGTIISFAGLFIVFSCTAQGAEQEKNNITTYFQVQGFNVVEFPCTLNESSEETLIEVQENKWHLLNFENGEVLEGLQQIELQFKLEEKIENPEIFIITVVDKDSDIETKTKILNSENNFTVILEPPFSEQGYQWKWTQNFLPEEATEENGEENILERSIQKLDITLIKKYKTFDLNAFCMGTAMDAIDEGSEALFQKAIDEGMNFIVLGSQSIAQQFNVSFETTSTLEKVKGSTLIDPDYFIYINDEKGIAQFRDCTNESFYNYPEKSENALVKQWICLRERGTLQRILFISPTFFLISSAERAIILKNSQVTGIQVQGANNQESIGPQFNFITLGQGMTFLGIFIFVLTLGLMIFFLKNKLKKFIKENPQKFTWSCVWILLGLGLTMEVFYYTGITEIPLSFFKIYFGLYGISSFILVIKGRTYLLAPFKNNAKRDYFQRNEEKIIQWVGRLFVGSGILWLYFFFFLKEKQWIPLIGFCVGGLILLLIKPLSETINGYKEPFEKIILWSLKALPFILVGAWMISRLYATLMDDHLFYWTASQWDIRQEITLTDIKGNPLQVYYRSENAGILSFNDALITLVSSQGNFPTQNVKVSMALDAGQEMDIRLLKGDASQQKNTLFYIPRLDELSLMYCDEKNGMAIYRYKSSKTFSVSKEDTDFKVFIKNHFIEENKIANLSSQQNIFLKPSFLEEGESFLESQTRWNVPLIGGQKYEFYTEVMDETFSLDLSIGKLPNSALGGEFLQVTLFDSLDNLIAQKQEKINYGFYNQMKTQTLSFKIDHLNPGLYKVTLEGVPGEVTYFTPDISTAYEIDSMTVNSPFWIFYGDEIHSAGAGILVTKTGINALGGGQIFEFGEGGDEIIFDEKYLLSTSEKNWRSPFLFQVTDHITKTTEYVLIEDSVLENIEIVEKEGGLILSKTFNVEKNKILQWTLSPHNGEKEFWWVLKNITLEFL